MKSKQRFVCSSCGCQTSKWYGKCPTCGEWNTMDEEEIPDEEPRRNGRRPLTSAGTPHLITEVDTSDEIRFSTGYAEMDRVLGGGAVKGSLVLIGGEPGIGKSTLLLQICGSIRGNPGVLYVSGEESERQIKLRADRLNISNPGLLLFTETNIDTIITTAEKVKPETVVVDSIQTMYRSDLNAAPGSLSQVRECAMSLMQLAKSTGMTVFIVGHVNKEGAIAGPKVLEHMVDCVLYIEGEKYIAYRIMRAAKNRFGSTNEIGVFEMLSTGLAEVPNPSAALLSGRPEQVPGTCITCIVEGSRPILSEIQALVTPTVFGMPRRMTTGMDYNRMLMIMAVLEKRAGLLVNSCDAYINVVGGLHIDEPAADLALALAIASSFRDKPVNGKIAAFGEIGLTGELRAVSALEQRLAETARMGFEQCVIPKQSLKNIAVPPGLRVAEMKNVREAIDYCISG